MNHFTIVGLGYNSKPWIHTCLDSLVNQNYENYDIIMVDAFTNDGTYDVLREYERNYDNLSCIRKTNRCFQAENMRDGVRQAKSDSIILNVDFDDWLPHSNVLNILNEHYDENTWLTYGTYSEYHGDGIHIPARTDVYHRYPDEVIRGNNFREYRWMASHLRTYRKKLFDKIKDADLIDKDTNKYYTGACDFAVMLPMIEMCGERFKYIDKEMYVYNRTNANSVDRVDLKNQERQANAIRLSRRYERIESL